MVCPICEGIASELGDPNPEPCSFCHGSGQIEITCCPKKLIDRDMLEFLRLADHLEQSGMPPILGGSLDQCSSFMDALRVLRAEEAHWHASS